MKIDTIATLMISAGSFLIGGSLGLALNCKACSKMSTIELGVDIRRCSECKEAEEDNILYGERDEIIEEVREDPENQESLIDINKNIYGEDVYEEYNEATSGYIHMDLSESDTDVDYPEPYVISRDSYENEHLSFYKESLVYFVEDDVLCDDQDSKVEDREKFIGTEALNSFGEGSDDEDIVYVRNLQKGMDFEIVREYQSYKENVLGIKEDTPEYKEAREFFGLDVDEE